ncbi:MAG: FHA domain-containing protein [Planctomycetota bacterium]
MFRIQLLHLNGSRKGKRHSVDASPFVIGRHESCDLQFETRTISRRHCAILVQDDRIVVRDLKSRNGTAVDGQKLAPEESRELWHHSVLQIGKYTFRVSIRDRKTNDPCRPKPAGQSTLSRQEIPEPARSGVARKLLTELEDLASRLDTDSGRNPLFESTVSSSSDNDSTRIGASDNSVGTLDEAKAKLAQPGDKTDTAAMPKTRTDPISDSKRTDDEDATPSGKLPEHLKPSGPKDSQDAAATALKNLFVK